MYEKENHTLITKIDDVDDYNDDYDKSYVDFQQMSEEEKQAYDEAYAEFQRMLEDDKRRQGYYDKAYDGVKPRYV